MTKETIAKVRNKWGKLSKASLQTMVETDLCDLVRLVQQTYGISRNRAERECHDFQLTLRPVRNNNEFERVSILSGQRSYTNL